MSLWLKNPHSVEAVLKTRPKDVIELNLPKKLSPGAWERVEALAKKNRIPIKFRATPFKAHVELHGGTRGAPHSGDHKNQGSSSSVGRQGVAQAQIQKKASVSAESLFLDAKDRCAGRGLWLALDQVQDPHNLGAIFRSAAFFGVQGIFLTQERSVPLTETVYDTACGGVEYVPFTIQANLRHGLEIAKAAGLWVLGASEHASENLQQIELDRAWLLVIGNEENGLRRLTQESCDLLCKIAPKGEVGSLNASVAASVLMSYLSPPLN